MKTRPSLTKGSCIFTAILLLIFLFMLFAVPGVAAPAGKKGPRPVGATNSSNGGVYNPGEYGVIMKYITFQQDNLYNGDDEVSFTPPGKGMKPGKKVYEKNLQQYQLILRTGLWQNIDARLIIPFFDKELKRKSFAADFSDDNTGLGDMMLFSRYRLMSQKKKDPLNLAIGFGLQLPTGETDERDSSGKTPGYLQPGGGAWSPIFEVGAHKIIGPHWFGSHLLYKNSTEGELGDKDFTRPDVFKYNVSYGYALSNYFDLQLEVNGEVKSKAELNGAAMKNSGGHSLFISPGVHFKIAKGIHCGICAPITVYRHVNGVQPTEDYRLVAKFAVKF